MKLWLDGLSTRAWVLFLIVMVTSGIGLNVLASR
jgi:hypothetical protein